MTAVTDLTDRLRAARRDFLALRDTVESGRPWPLSDVFGVEPEAHWGPPEVLAHVAEMVPFWQGEIARVLDGSPEPVRFGRVATDALRIGVIERDRSLPPAELFERIDRLAGGFADRMANLTAAQAARRGLHPTLGEMTVAGIADRFVVSHLEDHVRQLSASVAASDPRADPRTDRD